MTNPLSSLSYTNKDFQSVYVELLDLVKELTHKWDPSISNESDPGVILLKLNAIIADKNNYNIDKNILEAFPETVTQEINARNAYKQLAYNMPWYKSATVDVMLRWIGDELGTGVIATIPKYTMITDEKTEVVYTLLEEVQFNKDQLVSSAKAAQGIIVTHTVNSSDVIDLVNLDYRNRLYLNDYMIAENGVFITNVDDNENNLWQQVDNLAVKTQGNRFYEFGVDNRNSVCYIEFPEDIDALIKSGLRVRYLLTQGAEGNIAAKVLDRFYEDITISVGNNDVTLNSEVIQLYNASASTDGSDPETIEQAYKSYKKTAGTFNTLVTLRDYLNAVYNSGLVSNGVVCDRLNDVQSSYSVVTDDTVSEVQVYQTSSSNEVVSYAKLKLTGSEQWKDNTYFQYDPASHTMTAIEKGSFVKDTVVYYPYNEAIDKDLTAFDLRLYLLHTPGILNSIDAYESTFNMEPSSGPVHSNVVGYVNQQQCISHDFKDIIPNVPCMFKNSYPLGIKIVPQHKLTSVQQEEVKVNIVKALWEVTNSRAIEFGEEPNYDTIYDTIMNADERIKVVIVDDFQYTTFATYWDGKQFKDIPISSDSKSSLIFEEKLLKDLEKYKPGESKELSKSRLENSYFIVEDTVYRYNSKKKKFDLYSELRKPFQKQVLAKSILAGKTPLFKQDTAFQYTVDQEFIDIEETDRITTNQVISPFGTNDNPELTNIPLDIEGNSKTHILVPQVKADSTASAEYKLEENESIRFLAPSFITDQTYSNYVKFELLLNESTASRKVIVNPREGFTDGNIYYMSETDYINKIILDKWSVSKDSVVRGAGTAESSALQISTENEQIPTRCTVNIERVDDKETYTFQFDSKLTTTGDDNFSVSIRAFAFNNCSGESSEWKTVTCTKEQSTWDKYTYSFNLGSILTGAKSFQVRFEIGSPNFTRYIDNFEVTNGTSTVVKQNFEGSWTFLKEDSGTWYRGQFDKGDLVYTAWINGDVSLYEDRELYEVAANTDYQLKQGDCITFYWRETDDDDAPFKYVKYEGISQADETPTKKSPIIKSNFTILGASKHSYQVSPARLNSSGEIVYGTEEYNTVLGFYGDNDLSGTKEIQIRKMNQVKLDYSKNEYYFITNKIVTDNVGDEYYQMDLRLTNYESESSEAPYRYTLKTDEYFIYTASDMTEFEILGPGTMIGMTVPYVPKNTTATIDSGATSEPDRILAKKVMKVEYTDIAASGISAFADYCQKVSSEDTVFVREQQIYSLAEGDTLMLNIDTDSDGKLISEFEMTTDTGEPKTSAKPYFCSWMDTKVKGFSVSYKPASGGNVSLPKLDVNDSDSMWLGRAYLNLDCSYDSAQEVVPLRASVSNGGVNEYKSAQSVFINDVTYPLKDEEDNVDTDAFYIESSIQLNKVGGSDVDISYLDGYGERQDTELYLYHTSDVFNKEPFQVRDDGTIVGTYSKFPEKTTSIEVATSFDKTGNYILSIQNLSDVATLKISDGSDLYSLNGGKSSLGRGTHYLKLTGSDYKSLTFSYSVPKGTELADGDYFIINKLFKYTDNEMFKDNYGYTSDDMIRLVQELDYENKFKYNYVVDEALKIDDPLEAKTFFDSNHIFNEFTIAKAETRMSDATDSSINIINNR